MKGTKYVRFYNITVEDVHMLTKGAFLQMSDSADARVSLLTARRMSAYDSAVISLSGSSSITLLDSTFTDNQAVYCGVVSA